MTYDVERAVKPQSSIYFMKIKSLCTSTIKFMKYCLKVDLWSVLGPSTLVHMYWTPAICWYVRTYWTPAVLQSRLSNIGPDHLLDGDTLTDRRSTFLVEILFKSRLTVSSWAQYAGTYVLDNE